MGLHALDAPAPAPLQPLSPQEMHRANTGLALAPAVYRERLARERIAADSDFLLASKLAQTDGRWQPVDPWAKRRLAWVGDVTGEVIPLSPLRDVNLFERVQGRHRAFYLNALRDFSEDHPARRFFRYVVITSGKRLVAGEEDLRGRRQEMMRRISAWQRIIWRRWKIETLLMVAEHTFDKDERSIHLHFNLLIWPHRALQSEKTRPLRCVKSGKIIGHTSDAWRDYLEFSRDYLGVWWKDCRKISDLEEIIKYCYKGEKANPQDATKKISSDFRRDITPLEANWLYTHTFRGRTITSYGSFKSHIRMLRENRLKLAYVADRRGQKHLRRIQLPPRRERDDSGINETAEDGRGANPKFENLVRGRTAPMAKACAWSEPGHIVENYTLRPCTPSGQKALDKMDDARAESLKAWASNGAPPPAVALAVSRAWEQAPDHATAARVRPLWTNTLQDQAAVWRRLTGHEPGGEEQLDRAAGVLPALRQLAGDGWQPIDDLDAQEALRCAGIHIRPGEEWRAQQLAMDVEGEAIRAADAGYTPNPFFFDPRSWAIVTKKQQQTALRAGAPSIVHTTDLTLHAPGPDSRFSSTAPPLRPPDAGNSHLKGADNRETSNLEPPRQSIQLFPSGAERLPTGELYDPETGEIFR